MSDHNVISVEDLEKAFDMIDSCPILKHGDGDYAALIDEQDAEKGVMICDKDGHVKMTMPLETYDGIMKLRID